MDRYLATIGKTEAEYRDQFRAEATERVKRSLALSQFIEDEGIEVTPEEVEADIDRMASDAGLSGDQIREIFGGESGRDVIERSLLTRKAHDRMTELAEGKELPPRPEKGEAVATEAPVAQAAEAQPEAAAVAAESGGSASEAAAAEAEPANSPSSPETTEEKDS
jgi:trigger factor